ncbi:MAG TPA: dihydroneopterin aldolase [Rhizobiaceae bacterium]|nr:dihydroneopterin aldolase [Rhizobiaceae bacterium]
MRCAVVKLGGSTAWEAERAIWIEAFAGSSLPLVIVPGGGPFANNVRALQKSMGFSEAAAHAMAILAMDQFGHVILDHGRNLVPAWTVEDIGNALRKRRIPVWLPSVLTTAAPDIAASWDVTSDSLAAWLAGRLGAQGLLLVKQSGAFSERDDIAALTQRGLLDPAFHMMLPAGIEFRLAGPRDAPNAAGILSQEGLPGIRIGSVLEGAA